MANTPIPYNSQPYSAGTVFTPSTTTSKKITLKGVSVTGSVRVAANTVSNQVLAYDDPTYTWLSTDTISLYTAIVNPMSSTRSIDLTNPAAPVVRFQVYAEGFKNANSTGKLTQTFDVAVTLNLRGSTLTLDSTFNPFIAPSSISAAVKPDPVVTCA